jgi:hypothetical protein
MFLITKGKRLSLLRNGSKNKESQRIKFSMKDGRKWKRIEGMRNKRSTAEMCWESQETKMQEQEDPGVSSRQRMLGVCTALGKRPAQHQRAPDCPQLCQPGAGAVMYAPNNDLLSLSKVRQAGAGGSRLSSWLVGQRSGGSQFKASLGK